MAKNSSNHPPSCFKTFVMIACLQKVSSSSLPAVKLYSARTERGTKLGGTYVELPPPESGQIS